MKRASSADYEFTNQAVDIERRMLRIQERMEERLSRKLDPEALRPMIGVENDICALTFDEIRTRSGSVETYLSDVLGVSDKERETLRERLST